MTTTDPTAITLYECRNPKCKRGPSPSCQWLYSPAGLCCTWCGRAVTLAEVRALRPSISPAKMDEVFAEFERLDYEQMCLDIGGEG